MLKPTSEHRGLLPSLRGEESWAEAALSRRWRSEGPSPALMVAGVVAVGLAAWALYKMGPEFIRYMKIRSM